MGHQKKKLENKPLHAIDVNSVIECIFFKLIIAKGVVIARSLMCLQGCCVTKEN
jgi:hypothetical protein